MNIGWTGFMTSVCSGKNAVAKQAKKRAFVDVIKVVQNFSYLALLGFVVATDVHMEVSGLSVGGQQVLIAPFTSLSLEV